MAVETAKQKVRSMTKVVIAITKDDIAEFLEGQLERKPLPKEVEEFIGYLETDVYEWMQDNFKSWLDK